MQKTTITHRVLSSFLVLLMLFTMIAELILPVSAAAPTITLKKISNIYDGSIYVQGQLKCARVDKINAYGLLFGEKEPEENKVEIKHTNGKTYTGTTSISTTVIGMQPGITYKCCLYAETTDGTLYKSGIMTFTTARIDISQPQTESITYNGAKLIASYTTNGSCPVNEVGFYYGTDRSCSMKVKATKKTNFSVSLKKLEHNQTYYYYAYVVSSTGIVYESDIQTFQTATRAVTAVSISAGTKLGSTRTKFGNGITSNKTVYLYDELRIKAEVHPDDALNKNVTFSTSDESILKIVRGTWIRAVAPGQATVTATTEDGGLTASFLITVKNEPYVDTVPVIISVKAAGEDSILLKWKRPSDFSSSDKVIYTIYRSDSPDGEFIELEQNSSTSTLDDGLEPDTTYYYKIQAYVKNKNLYQSTYFSNVVSATTKEHIYVPKKNTETIETSKNDIPAEPDPVETTPMLDTPAQPDPEEQKNNLPPYVSGLATAYTIEKGSKLSLRFTVEDAAGGVVEKVTVKQNVTTSTCTASLTNSKSGVLNCTFDLTDKIFDKVGTYDFNVYARATHFTVTDNCIGSFTVTVAEKVCQHTKYSDTKTIKYTDIILIDDKHTYYEEIAHKCTDCGADLEPTTTTSKTTGHSVNQKKRYCDCGYMDVSGYTLEPAYNKTGETQTVYRTPESLEWYGSINANENVTILGEWGNRYLIEYSLDGGGVKQGYVPMSGIQKVSEDEEVKSLPRYSLYIDDKYYYTNILDYKKLLVAEKYNYYKVKIYNETTDKYVALASEPNLKMVFYKNNGMTIDKYGTLCITPNDYDNNVLQLYYADKLVDSINIMCCTDVTRYSTLDAISDSSDWLDGNIYPNQLLSVKKKSLEYSSTSESWILGLDLYNDSFTCSGIVSYNPNGEIHEFHLIDGYWQDFGFAEDMIKCVSSIPDIPQLITGNMDARDSDFLGHTFQKTSIAISVPDGGYIKILCSNESDEVLIANITDLIIGAFETSDDVKALISDVKLKGNLRDCIDKSKFSNKVIAILNNYNMLGKIREIIVKEEASNATSQIISMLCGNENAMKEILSGMTECISSLPENIAFDFANKVFDLVIKGDKKHVFTQGVVTAGKFVQLSGIIKFTAAEIINDNDYSTHGLLIFAPN